MKYLRALPHGKRNAPSMMRAEALKTPRVAVSWATRKQAAAWRAPSAYHLALQSRPQRTGTVARAIEDAAPAVEAPKPKAATKRPSKQPKRSLEFPARWLKVEEDIKNKDKVVVAHVAPSVRVVIGEALGYGPGMNLEKQLVTGLRHVGFDYVFDTMFTADLTIIEEGHELIRRIHDKLLGTEESLEHPMPMFTSCCPGWIQLAEKSYPELLPHISTCKSPQMMMGAIVKSFFAEQLGVTPDKIAVVSIMPCVRKQPEADRDIPEFTSAAAYFQQTEEDDSAPACDVDQYVPLPCPLVPETCYDGTESPIVACEIDPSPDTQTDLGAVRDLDHVLTTLEIAQVFDLKGVELRSLPPRDFDVPLGVGGGAAQLFGSTGGVMEAALRTAYELITGQQLDRINFEAVRGLDAVRTATVELVPSETGPLGAAVKAAGIEGPIPLKVAVVNGLGNAKKVATAVKQGEMDVDFVEIMACPGGCIGGGGNPRALTEDLLRQRQGALYSIDERKQIRRSHENPFITMLYDRFLGEPGSHIAHELLHTHYVPGGPPSVNPKK